MDALEALRAADVPMLFVHDEYGHFEGIVTPADLLRAMGSAELLQQGTDGLLLAAVAAQTMPANAEDLVLRSAALGEDRLLVGAAEIAFARHCSCAFSGPS